MGSTSVSRNRLDSMARVLLTAVLALVMAVAVLGAAGCSGDATSEGSGTQQDDSAANEAAAAEPEIDAANLAVGEIVTIEGVSVGVKAIEKGPKDWGGDETIRVTVVYDNGTDGEVSFNSFDWSVQDENGVRKDASLTDDDSLSSGDLAPGGKVEGDVFLPAKGASKVVYTGNWLFDSEDDKLMWVVE